MGVDFNIISAKGLILYDPDSYIKYVNYDEIDGMTDLAIQNLRANRVMDYDVIMDCYSKNSPIFIYDKTSVLFETSISRAHCTNSFKSIIDCEHNYDRSRPYIIGQDPAVYPVNFYDYDDEKCQQENINRMLKLFPLNTYYGNYCLVNDNVNKNKMRYGEFVFVYYS